MDQDLTAQYWQAVAARDAEWDGKFVYGVSSTHIFCRPSCASRRPRREGVRFFASPEAAQAAGFRACKRCRPHEPRENERAAWVARAARLLEAETEAAPTLSAVGAQVHASPHHVQRTFKKMTGITPKAYAEAKRLERLKEGLQVGETVTTSLYAAGYGSTRGLYERAQARLGMTPATYRRGGTGLRISFSVVACSLGQLLVARTDKGLCAVMLGDEADALEQRLRSEFFAAEVQRDAGALGEWTEAILRYLEGEPPHFDLPLDIRATAFQWRVWQALCEIPCGETRSYGEVAQTLGQPRAVRAVAQACAANPTALVVPCHRIVQSSGGLGGYKWGVERKRKLLERERADS